MSSLNIQLKLEETETVAKQRFQLPAGNPKEQLRALQSLFKELNAGLRSAAVNVQTSSADPVKASGTLTLDTVIATDVFVVGGTTFTGTDTPTTNLHFDTSLATDDLIAADMVRAVNEHPTANQIVTASAAAKVVTITANVPGPVGNFINIASVDSTITASAATLESGAGGAAETGVDYNAGISF